MSGRPDYNRKTCPRCGIEKDLIEFYKNKHGRYGESTYCRVCTSEYASERYITKGYLQNRKAKVRRKGLELEDYDKMLAEQNGVCAICKGACPTGRALIIDHNHSCCEGEKTCGRCNRGLLCIKCNHMIGLAYENIETLENAINYIREWNYGKKTIVQS